MSIVLPFKLDTEHARLGEWVNTSNENSLKEMANLIEAKIIRSDSVPGSKDHAIPSPVAHIMDFRKKLRSKDEKTVLVWKGMLAAIALRDNYGLNIEMKLIDLTSTLGMVIKEGLVESCNWQKDINALPVFFKDDIPFAFGVPDTSICPYKEYPGDLFAGLDWYNEEDGVWIDPPVSIRTEEAILRGTLTAQGKKLYYWLAALRRNLAENNPYENIYDDYVQSALFNVELTGEDEEIFSALSEHKLYKEELSPPKERLLNTLKIRRLIETAKPPEGALQVNELFADNTLIYIPQKVNLSAEEQKTYMPFHYLANLKDYRDSIGDAYIIPPISKKLIECIKEYEGDIKIETIFYKDSDCEGLLDLTKKPEEISLTCTVTVHFMREGQTINYKKKFKQTNIVWTDAMPYLLLWPNVNLPEDHWNAYYLGVAKHNRSFNTERSEYEFVSDSERFFRLLDIDITATTKSNSNIQEFTVSSAYNPVEGGTAVRYTMLHSETIFESIGLYYRKDNQTFELGYLIIDHNQGPAYNNDLEEFNRSYKIGIDFGTTSTNVFIKEEQSETDDPRSISSPGAFLLDLTRTDDSQDQIDKEIYFFAKSKVALGKIFTAGQLFDARLGEYPAGEKPYIAGKFIEIDQEQFWEPLSRNVDFSYFGIFFRLKFSDDINDRGKTTEAARLFILSLLQTALLECRINGAERVSIHYSYPFGRSGYNLSLWSEVINIVKHDFSKIDSNAVSYQRKTESEAAGEFFKRYSAKLGARPILRRGYAIVDIGGGTTDVSLWRKPSDESEESFIRAQHSFKYAGQHLVNRTLIQSVFHEKDLKKYIQLSDKKNLEIIADAYSVARSIKRPIGSTWNPGVIKANSILDILLDKDCFLPEELHKNVKTITFVRLKFIALFYLIARYMKSVDDKDIYNNEANFFTLHLAGCGAKGLEFCAASKNLGAFNQSEFGKALINMMKSILGLPVVYTFKIMAPLCDDKEEVVTGLVMTETRDDRENAMPNERQDQEDPTLITISYEEAAKSYQAMLECIKEHCAGQLGYPNTSKGVMQFFELIEKNVNLTEDFRGAFDGIVSTLENSNLNKDTLYDNFSLLMLDDLIDQFAADPQRYIE